MFPLKTHSLILRRQLWSITLSSKMSNEKSKPYIICFLWTRRYNQPKVAVDSLLGKRRWDAAKAAKAWGKAALSTSARFCATASRASQACCPLPGPSWRGEAHLWAHSWDLPGPESASGERGPGRGHLPRARQAETVTATDEADALQRQGRTLSSFSG